MVRPGEPRRAPRRSWWMIRPVLSTASPLLISVLAIVACAAEPVGRQTPRQERELAEVRSIELRLPRTRPRRLSVTIHGVAPTPGYSHLRLRPFQYIQPPPDGIYDYTLVGVPPANVVPAVTTPVSLTETLLYSSDLKGVRVHAQSSSVTALITDAARGPKPRSGP